MIKIQIDDNIFTQNIKYAKFNLPEFESYVYSGEKKLN